MPLLPIPLLSKKRQPGQQTQPDSPWFHVVLALIVT
jgi:hypothetical protein